MDKEVQDRINEFKMELKKLIRKASVKAAKKLHLRLGKENSQATIQIVSTSAKIIEDTFNEEIK